MSTVEQIEMTDVISDTDSEPASSSGSGSEMDEETGLTKRERRQRNRQYDQLDVRIGEHIPVSKHEARLADRDVVKKLLINSVLILLWYFFSLSISIVSTAVHCKAAANPADIGTVQQVDVRQGSPRLSLPTIHYFSPHDRSILSLDPRSLLCTISPSLSAVTTIHKAAYQSHSFRRPRFKTKTCHNPPILAHSAAAMRYCHISRHWPGQHLPPLHNPHLSHNVQIVVAGLCPPLRLSLPT
jgi:hypothetical protein